MLRNVILLFIVIVFISGCATNYKSVDFLKVGMTTSVKKDLTNNYLIGKTIEPNAKIIGLVVLYNTNYAPLDFEIVLD